MARTLRISAGNLTSSEIGDFFSNFHGNSRLERLHYDTPECLGGFVASASVGEDDSNDTALRHSGTFGDFRVRTTTAFAETQTRERLSDSVSALHESTALHVTFATGTDDQEASTREPVFNYIKFGCQTDFQNLNAVLIGARYQF